MRILVMLCLLLAVAPPAWAHKVVASVFASGDAVEGEIGFSDGIMAANVTVEVFDAQGTRLGETRTDPDGTFRFKPAAMTALLFRADLGAGHVAEARFEPDGSAPPPSPAAAETGEGFSAGQRELVAEMIRRELKPLRHEIAAYKEKNDLQSILGGIGYIAGLFGVGFYMAARRRMAENQR